MVIECHLNLETVEGCGRENDVVVTSIEFPLDYDDITFDFVNIGTVISTVVDVLGHTIIENHRERLVNIIKQKMRSEVASLVCDEEVQVMNVTALEVRLEQRDWDWRRALRSWRRARGWEWMWGGTGLWRDHLAEKLVSKVFEESISPHLKDPQHRLQKTFDPLFLFPIEFNFRKKHVYRSIIEYNRM